MMLVEWDDSCSSSSWKCRHEPDNISHCVSLGILLREDDREIEVCPNISMLGNKLHSFAIPKGCIRRMRVLCLK